MGGERCATIVYTGNVSALLGSRYVWGTVGEHRYMSANLIRREEMHLI